MKIDKKTHPNPMRFFVCKQNKLIMHKAGFVNIVGNPNVGSLL